MAKVFQVKGIPVLFIPGNAGSYKQVRSYAAEAAHHFHDVVRHDHNAVRQGKRPLDFFSVDFNEDFTAFHGQTLLDQAEYLNEAIAYILSLYQDPLRSLREPDLPDPNSVIVLGHSMGGVVARTMMTMSNFQANSINTIITLSAPHARAPVSFDADIVAAYKNVNSYWREAFSQIAEDKNPLSHVSLISIAGGGLDTVVPSDYASVSSLVPPTNGFTVFTSTIPKVWTGMDHLEITWCDQVRKVIIRAMYDIVDSRRAGQTKSREDRLLSFRKFLLTGMEESLETSIASGGPQRPTSLSEDIDFFHSNDERLVLRTLGAAGKPTAHLLPISSLDPSVPMSFRLLTNQKIDAPGEDGRLEVLFCNNLSDPNPVYPSPLQLSLDLTERGMKSRGLSCISAASDSIALPSSTHDSKFPFEDAPPFSYLQYNIKALGEQQYVAVVDKATEPTSGWVIAQFSRIDLSVIHADLGLRRLLSSGLDIRLPPTRPFVVDIKIPALRSSLLSYKLHVSRHKCGEHPRLFAPMVRQYITEPYESKFFVNVRDANINLHGIAPYMPPPLQARNTLEGMSLQIWADPTCGKPMNVRLTVDILGSLGKLWMRYRIVCAAFPLIVVAMVIRKQFKVYDATGKAALNIPSSLPQPTNASIGVFMSFSESMDQCLRTSLPVLFLALTFFALSLARTSHADDQLTSHSFLNGIANATDGAIDFTKNDLLLGSQDPFFWFLVPFFGLISIGVCIALNYAVLGVTHVSTVVYNSVRSVSLRSDDGRSVLIIPPFDATC